MWALGVVCYVMMSGYPPFDGETDADVYASIICARY
jgi:calcium/calmodulin-dependent protein kinase I